MQIHCNSHFYSTALGICYLVYDQTEKEHKRLQRKNPADYEHEK